MRASGRAKDQAKATDIQADNFTRLQFAELIAIRSPLETYRPLLQVASLIQQSSLQQIFRRHLKYFFTVYAEPASPSYNGVCRCEPLPVLHKPSRWSQDRYFLIRLASTLATEQI